MTFEEEFPRLAMIDFTDENGRIVIGRDDIQRYCLDKAKVKETKESIKNFIQTFFSELMNMPQLQLETSKSAKLFVEKMIRDPILLDYVDTAFKELGL